MEVIPSNQMWKVLEVRSGCSWGNCFVRMCKWSIHTSDYGHICFRPFVSEFCKGFCFILWVRFMNHNPTNINKRSIFIVVSCLALPPPIIFEKVDFFTIAFCSIHNRNKLYTYWYLWTTAWGLDLITEILELLSVWCQIHGHEFGSNKAHFKMRLEVSLHSSNWHWCPTSFMMIWLMHMSLNIVQILCSMRVSHSSFYSTVIFFAFWNTSVTSPFLIHCFIAIGLNQFKASCRFSVFGTQHLILIIYSGLLSRLISQIHMCS